MVKKSNRTPPLVVTIPITKTDGTVSKKSVAVISNGYTLFFNAQHHLIKLNNKERAFFDFLCEKMSMSTNDIFIDRNLKDSFIKFIAAITSTKIELSEDAVNKYVEKLSSLGFIIRSKTLARYNVNPKYAFRGTKQERENCIKNLIETRIAAKLPIAALINEPEEEFLK